jgi:HK97 family phage portal protein
VIVKKIMNAVFPNIPTTMTLPELVQTMGFVSSSGQTVTPETAKNVATAYRCINIICNDFAKLPEQVFISKNTGQIEHIKPSARMQNTSWLLERKPNRWMTPFKFKRLRMAWLLSYGASYVWQPVTKPGQKRELFILPSDRTWPEFDEHGQLWYKTIFSDNSTAHLPFTEVSVLLINSMDGITGKGVISYARETLGRRMGASETQAGFYEHGLNPGGIIHMNGEVNAEARKKVRDSYAETMSGSDNAYRLAVLDNKVAKFEQITMKPVDVQFLQGIEQNDTEVANFFDMPLYKLNMGKQTYNSNEQANLEYLSSTLDPYLVQAEEVDTSSLLSEDEQEYIYIKFNRDALLRTDAATRASVHKTRIESGMETPNEGRQIEDMASYQGGDAHYFPANMAVIGSDGSLKGVGNGATSTGN